MKEFKDFLLDYEMKENEEIDTFLKKAAEGTIERYPPSSRFTKLREPLAGIELSKLPIWGIIPFYGSTVFPLQPIDKNAFDDFYRPQGFTSKDLDMLIDFVKQTGRLQFVLTRPPTEYQNLDFLRPLFDELRPPMHIMPIEALFGPKRVEQYYTEFDTLASLEPMQTIIWSAGAGWLSYEKVIRNLSFYYVLVRAFGDRKLVEDVQDAIVTDPAHGAELLTAVASLYLPTVDPLKLTSNFSLEHLAKTRNNLKKYRVWKPDLAVYEIGKFILDKMIHYPVTLDGCMEIVQHYQDHDLLRVSEALHQAVKAREVEILKRNSAELSTILDNVWKDASKVRHKRDFISYGVSTAIGLVGELASVLPGAGILAALGFQALDRFTEAKISERLAKLISSNYLVAIYDFREKLASK